MSRTQLKMKIGSFLAGLIAAAAVVCLTPSPGSNVSAQEVIWRGPVSAYYFGRSSRTNSSYNSGYGRRYDNGNGERYYSGYGPSYNNGTYGPAMNGGFGGPAYNGGFGQNPIQAYGNVYGGPNYNAPPYRGYSNVRGDLGYSIYFPQNVTRFYQGPDQGWAGYGYGAPGVLAR